MSEINLTGVTTIPNYFIDEYIPKSAPIYSLVYILGLRMATADRAVNRTEIARALKITPRDVSDAWQYWEESGLIEVIGDSVKFKEVEPPPSNDGAETEAVKPVKTASIETRPVYTPLEIERYQLASGEIRSLFKSAETILGKPLTYNEMNLFLSFHEWNNLPVDVIEALLEYCVSNGHSGMRYIEKVALDWDDNGIDTLDKAIARIQLFNSDYRRIMKAFGVSSRDASKTEQKFMHKWLKEWNIPMDVILEACERAILNTGKVSFKYSDKILTEWKEKSIETLMDIAAADKSYYESKDMSAKIGADKPVPRKTRQANFDQREVDFDEIERLERERINKILNASTPQR